MNEMPSLSSPNLTRMERIVLHLSAEGMSSRQIGERLCVSPRTVNFHRNNLFGKLGVSSVIQAVRCCATIQFHAPFCAPDDWESRLSYARKAKP